MSEHHETSPPRLRTPALAPKAGLDAAALSGAVPARERLAALWDRYRRIIVPLVALAALVVYFASQSSDFLTGREATNILRQSSFLLVLALAGTMVILIGAIDLSVAANATLAGIVISNVIDSTGALGAVILTIALGASVGLVNGGLTTLLRVPSFLVTLGMLSVLDGISNSTSHGAPVAFQSHALGSLVNKEAISGVPNGSLIALALALLLTGIGFYTRFGRYLYAVGANERAAKLAGVRIVGMKLAVFALAGALAACAGIIFTAESGTGVPLGADPSLLNSIAAVVVGGTALSGGVGGPHRTILGTLVIVVLSSGMDLTSVGPYTQDIVKGLVVVGAVALTIDRRRYGAIK
jgi:ribose transport system permease protein